MQLHRELFPWSLYFIFLDCRWTWTAIDWDHRNFELLGGTRLLVNYMYSHVPGFFWVYDHPYWIIFPFVFLIIGLVVGTFRQHCLQTASHVIWEIFDLYDALSLVCQVSRQFINVSYTFSWFLVDNQAVDKKPFCKLW